MAITYVHQHFSSYLIITNKDRIASAAYILLASVTLGLSFLFFVMETNLITYFLYFYDHCNSKVHCFVCGVQQGRTFDGTETITLKCKMTVP